MKILLSAILTIFSTTYILSNNFKEMTLHEFMEDYVELGEKKFKKGDSEYLKKLLQEIPNFAIDSDKERWKEISDKAIESGNLTSSCKNCHKIYKRDYKKSYKKRLIQVPEELILKK